MPASPEQILAAQIASMAWRALAESGETMSELAGRIGVFMDEVEAVFHGNCARISSAATVLAAMGYQINVKLRHTAPSCVGENFYEKEADQ